MPARSPRSAATLVELIMGMTVTMIVVTLAASQIARLQRAYASVAAAIELRTALRDGADILVADLRGTAPSADSILVASDTAVEFMAAVGTATLCATPTPNAITIPPDSLPSGRILSAWIESPEAGDQALIFADSATPSSSGWQRARIVSVATVPTSAGCPTTAGLLSAADAAAATRSYQLTFAPAVSVNIGRGAPVRITRRVRYSVYRAGDGKWYLGFRRCDGGCAAIQPVSGPYSGNGPPITFRYFGHDGAELAPGGPAVDVARVAILLSASYQPPFRLPGMAAPIVAESVVTIVAIRN